MSPNNWVIRRSLISSTPILNLSRANGRFGSMSSRAKATNSCQPIQGVSLDDSAPILPGRPKRRTLRDLCACFTTCSNTREGSHESSCDRFGRWHGALRRHVGAGIGHAHGQPRGCGERSRAGPKRALRVQSVSMPVAAELRLPPVGLRLWTELLQLRAKLLQLCTKLLRLRTRLVRRLVWRRSIWPVVVVRRAIVCSGLRLSPKLAAVRQG